jgi:hypothetical protein
MITYRGQRRRFLTSASDSFILRPLYINEKSPNTNLTGGSEGPINGLETVVAVQLPHIVAA